VLDALGVCGGTCAADADNDSVCDDVDPCVGNYDSCGVCNGPGAVFACGCTGIPAGSCDCAGNVLDAIDVCAGTCAADADNDTVCDDVDPCVGNYDSCGVCNGPGPIFACGCTGIPAGTCDCAGNVLDALGVCGGTCAADADNDTVCDSVDPCVGNYDSCGICNGPGAVYACGCTGIPAGTCDCAGNVLDALGVCGGTCAADTDNDNVCDNVDPCVGNYDSCGVCNGPGAVYACGCTGIPAGTCDCAGNVLDALGVCGGTCAADADSDNVCDDVDPCVGNYDSCGVCNGPGAVYACGCTGIPAGTCDCAGNVLDALGVCGGTCVADADNDSVCDDVDPCVGNFDACGVCNGPGAIYTCGCTGIPAGTCDCAGNVLDALGVCGGTCAADTDNDNVCDNVDPCVGNYDSCGVCNGPGAVYACGCTGIPAGTCDCAGNVLDALGVCGGTCAADADNDSVCDDVDPCVGNYDSCGICNGPGPIYACGCTGIPAGTCDCAGNVLDALGVCGGTCAADADNDSVCDDVDPCVGNYDSCGVCNGPGAVFACGCTGIPAGSCDCAGNVLDAIDVCAGTCAADADNDNVCDNVDPCVGNYDSCGVCNGPGAIYACGCSMDGCDFCIGDYTGDGARSTADLLVLLSEFGCLSDCPSDITWDDVVGVDDLLAFLSVFASSCP
jgi:ABC-type Fe3+-citrate transport system substrate-binding protein